MNLVFLIDLFCAILFIVGLGLGLRDKNGPAIFGWIVALVLLTRLYL